MNTFKSTSDKAPLNLIWIIVDSVRHYRGAGDDRDKLEVMDELASEAVEFETVVTAAGSSLMSISAMFTGCPSYLIARDFDNFTYDKSTFVSIGEVLKNRGYNTYGIFQYAYGRERLGGKIMDLVGPEHFPPGLETNRRWSNDEINQIFFNQLDAGLQEPFFLCLWYNCREDMET